MASFFTGLNTDFIQLISTANIASLTTADYAGITTDQIAALTTDQVQALESRDLVVLSTVQVAKGFTTDQIVALTTAQALVLTSVQLGGLTTDQVAALETGDFAALKSTQIAALTSTQISKGLSTDQIKALTTAQVGGLTTLQIQNGLTTDQVAALETRDLILFKTNQVQALTTDQVRALTSAQATALTTAQVRALSSSQLNALTTDNFGVINLSTPLVLDLNGDGITTKSIAAGVEFDLYASGQNVQTGWVAGGDGLLVMDRNHDGVINDGGELFGEATVLQDGQKAANGYVALSEMDSNDDGVIDRSDTGFSDLRVWVDANSDGVSESGEVRTLDSLGISKLNLAATSTWVNNNGNFEGLTSSYEKTDGTTRAMADIWFATETPSAAAATAEGLGSRVGGLVQAIGAFNESQATSANKAPLPGLGSPTGAGAGAPSVAMSVSGIVDALKQFDPNGCPVAVSGAVQSVPAVTSLTTPSVASSTANGILAIGK